MLNNYRPQLNRITEKIVKNININPDIITVLGLFISIFAGAFYATDYLTTGAFFIIVSGFCDVLDGAIARVHKRKTRFGGFLDSVCDRFADASILIGILIGGYVNPVLIALALHSSFTVSYVRSRAENENMNCTVGLAERAERLLILVVGSVIATILGMTHNIMTVTLAVLTIVSYFTVAQRVYHTYKTLNGNSLY